MELLLLILIAPALWLLFLPRRVARRIGQFPMIKPAVVGAILLVGWAMLSGLRGTDPPAPAWDYARGDTALRAMLD